MSENKPFKLYSNEISLSVNAFDFTIQFKHNTQDEVEVLGNISLSPQHAKVFASVLAQNISQYEEIFGKINEPNEETFRRLHEQGIMKMEPQ